MINRSMGVAIINIFSLTKISVSATAECIGSIYRFNYLQSHGHLDVVQDVAAEPAQAWMTIDLFCIFIFSLPDWHYTFCLKYCS